MNTLAARRRHPLAALALLVLALLAVGGAYTLATGAATAEAAPAASTATATQIEEGRQLYLEGCSSCHGLNAEGVTAADLEGSNGPGLIGVGAASVDFQVGTGRMPLAVPGPQAPAGPKYTELQYTQEQINALAAYVASLGPGPAIPTEEMLDYEDADLAEGGELFRANCSQCHNFAGKGGALTNGKYAPPVVNSEPVHIYEAMLTGPQSMPVFGERTILPEQKRAIIKFIKTTAEEPNPGGLALGRIGPVAEGLVVWIVGLGALAAVAVWIGVKSK